jgi:hypothetical protein
MLSIRTRGDDVAEHQDREEHQQDHGQQPQGQQVAEPFDGPEVGEHAVGNDEQEGPEGNAQKSKDGCLQPVAFFQAREPVLDRVAAGVEESQHSLMFNRLLKKASLAVIARSVSDEAIP